MKISNGKLACAFLCASVVATLFALGTIYFEGPLLQYFPKNIYVIRDTAQFSQGVHEQRLHKYGVHVKNIQNSTKAVTANATAFPMDVKMDTISPLHVKLDMISTEIIPNLAFNEKNVSNLTFSRKIESSFVSNLLSIVTPTVALGRTPTKSITPKGSLTTLGPPRVLPNGVERLICVQLVGGMGNQLFQYASGLGLAYFMRRTPVFLTRFDKLEGVLNASVRHPTKQEHYEERCKRAKGVSEGNCCMFSEKLTRLSFEYDWYVRTYLQSWKYWIYHEENVKEKIQFSLKVQEQVSTILKTLRGLYNDSELIGVHVRKGDMANLAHKRLGYPTATPEYIEKALKYFINIFHKAVFVVASDSMKWCKNHFPNAYKLHYLENNTAAIDLAILASLDHIVISFGTYSWWAGYLNKGLTVYMKDFLMNGSYLSRQFNPEGRDYIYPGWVPM